MSGILSTMVVKLVGDISEFSKSMDSAQSKIGAAGSAMSSTGGMMTAGVTAPILAAGAATFSMANTFNSGMANVASLSEEAQAAVAGWAPMVQNIALETGKSTTDITGGLYTVVSAFGVADDSLQVLDTNARAAAAGLATTEEAISLTSAVTKAYNDTSAEAVQHAADLALKTVQLGQTTFPELASAIGTVAPLSNEMGVSLEEMFGVMATGTGVTGTASQVSTQLRGVLSALMAPTADMTALFNDMGVESGKAFLDVHGLEDGITNIIAAAEASGTPLQKYIGSIEGQTLALALSGSQADTWYEKTRAMSDAAGSVDAAFAAQTQGINKAGFAAAQMGVRMQLLGERIGQTMTQAFLALEPYLNRFVGFIERAVTWFGELSPKMQGSIFAFLGLAAALGPILVVLGTVVSSVGTLVGLFGSITTAVAGGALSFSGIAAVLTGPFALAIGAVVAAVGLLYLAWTTNFMGIQQVTQTAWTGYIQPMLMGISTFVTGTLIPAITNLYNQWVTVVWPQIQTITQNSWTIIQTVFTELGRRINDNLVPWVTLFGDLWVTKFNMAKSEVQSMIAVVAPIFEKIKGWLSEKIPGALTTVAGAFGLNMSQVESAVNSAKSAITLIIDAVKGFATWLSSTTFSFKFDLPDLPEWAIPGSPIPLHTRWKDFDRDLKTMSFAPSLSADPLQGAAGALSGSSGGGGVELHFHGPVFGLSDFEGRIMDIVNESVNSAVLNGGSR